MGDVSTQQAAEGIGYLVTFVSSWSIDNTVTEFLRGKSDNPDPAKAIGRISDDILIEGLLNMYFSHSNPRLTDIMYYSCGMRALLPTGVKRAIDCLLE